MANRILNLLKQIVVRSYTLVILLVLVWTGYTAVTYLFSSVFYPTHVPEWFLDWRGHLEAEALHAEEIAGVTKSAPRAPLNHFHGVDRWFQPDPHNGCATKDCHSPLAHSESKGFRAFANLHATFLACETCHNKNITSPVKAMWVNTTSGKSQDPPGILQLMRYLEVDADKISNQPATAHPVILELLHQAKETVGDDPLLDYLLLEIENSEPGSPVWREAVIQLMAELPVHARGEYGAKLAPEASDDEHKEYTEKLEEQTRKFFAAPADSKEREAINEQIHAGLVVKPSGCLACHGDVPARLDFESLGYSPRRVKDLGSSQIAKQMQHILQGEPFYLPRLLKDADKR